MAARKSTNDSFALIAGEMHSRRKNRLSVVIFLLSQLLANLAFANVTDDFNKAQKLFNAGKTQKSQKIVTKNLSKFPEHLPSLLLQGKILFRRGMPKKAAKFFGKIPIEMIQSSDAYMYGISFYTTKRYKRAIQGFQKVPQDSSAYDLAMFYLAVSYVHTQKWWEAKRALSRVRKLPTHLRPVKRRLTTSINRRLDYERRGQGGGGGHVYYITPTPYYDPLASNPSNDKNKKKASPQQKPKLLVGFANSITPSFVVNHKTVNMDLFEFGTSSSHSQIITAKVHNLSTYRARPNSSGEQIVYSLALSGAQVRTSTKGEVVHYVASESDTENIRQQLTSQQDDSLFENQFFLMPKISVPIRESLDIDLNYSIFESLPDGERESMAGVKGPLLRAALEAGPITLAFTASLLDHYSNQETLQNVTKFRFDMNLAMDDGKSLSGFAEQIENNSANGAKINPEGQSQFGATFSKNWESSHFDIGVTQNSFLNSDDTYGIDPGTPTAPPIPLEELKITVANGYSFSFGGSLDFVLNYYQSESNLTTFPVDDGEQASLARWDSTANEFIAKFRIQPISWIYFSGEYQYKMVSIQAVEPAVSETKLMQNQGEVITTNILEMGIQATF